jgi:hypothetical protein
MFLARAGVNIDRSPDPNGTLSQSAFGSVCGVSARGSDRPALLAK